VTASCRYNQPASSETIEIDQTGERPSDGCKRRTYHMTPHPKRKHSKGRRDRRRAHDALVPLNTVACSNCGAKRLPHTVCSSCGFYNGREVIQIKKEKKASA